MCEARFDPLSTATAQEPEIIRREVVKELQRLERATKQGAEMKELAATTGGDWILDMLADVSQEKRGTMTGATALEELGFDSLMFTELAVEHAAAGRAAGHVGQRQTRYEEAPVKRIALWSLSALLCTGFVVAQDTMKDDHMKSDSMKMSGKMMTAKGMVTKVDESGKMMMIKDRHGKEMTINWDGSTKVMGEMKEGSRATVRYMMREGK